MFVIPIRVLQELDNLGACGDELNRSTKLAWRCWLATRVVRVSELQTLLLTDPRTGGALVSDRAYAE